MLWQSVRHMRRAWGTGEGAVFREEGGTCIKAWPLERPERQKVLSRLAVDLVCVYVVVSTGGVQ